MDVSPAGLAASPSPKAQPAQAVPSPVLPSWLRVQSINVTRHAAALRPFRREEFGTGAAAPSEGYIQAANTLITALRRRLLGLTREVAQSLAASSQQPSTQRLQAALGQKENAHRVVE